MFNPKTNYAKIAYDAVLFFITTGQTRKKDPEKISEDLRLNRNCIVSIYDSGDKLRGVHGNVIPTKRMLYDEIINNAIAAASNDKKFSPVSVDELNKIKVYVDVISDLHKIENPGDIKPKKHGIFIKDGKGESGYVMPNTEGVNTHEQQIEKAKQLGGIVEKDQQNLEIYYFKSTRYD